MKNINKLLYISCITVLAIQLMACKDDQGVPLTEKDIAMQALEGTWSVHPQLGVSINDSDVTGEFIAFELTFDNQLNFTSSGADLEQSPWPSNGNFIFGERVTQLIRNDGLEMTAIPSEDGTSIAFSFTFAEGHDNGTGGRQEAILGNWLFNLIK